MTVCSVTDSSTNAENYILLPRLSLLNPENPLQYIQIQAKYNRQNERQKKPSLSSFSKHAQKVQDGASGKVQVMYVFSADPKYIEIKERLEKYYKAKYRNKYESSDEDEETKPQPTKNVFPAERFFQNLKVRNFPLHLKDHFFNAAIAQLGERKTEPSGPGWVYSTVLGGIFGTAGVGDARALRS